MILDDIKEKLETIDDNVFYGVAPDIDPCNYITFARISTDPKQNNQSFTDKFGTVIVRENYIEDGLADRVIEAMMSIPGVKIAQGAFTYSYARKGKSSSDVIELLEIDFVLGRKADGRNG